MTSRKNTNTTLKSRWDNFNPGGGSSVDLRQSARTLQKQAAEARKIFTAGSPILLETKKHR